MANIRLVTYSPLCRTAHGRTAIEKFKFSPFIDNSCRREPDFENPFPSISALCRASKLAPKLEEGDIVVYITKKAKYEQKYLHWKLVAILKVIKRLETHEIAGNWYSDVNLPMPSNCMIKTNPCKTIEETGGLPKEHQNVGSWDIAYQIRAKNHTTFLACEALFMNIDNPPIITEKNMENIFGKVNPGTQNPKYLSNNELEELEKLTKNNKPAGTKSSPLAQSLLRQI